MTPFTDSLNSLPADEAARRWRASLAPELRRSRFVRGTAIFAVSALIYCGLFLGAFFLPTFVLRSACLWLLPIVIGALFVIGHDAAHNSLTPYGWLNRSIGRISMLPAWHPYTAWTHSHNTLHHGGTNLRGKHPDFVPFTKAEYDNLPLWRKVLERAYRSPLGVGLSYILDFYGRYMFFPRGPRRSPFRLAFELDRLLVVGFLALQLTLAIYLCRFTPNLLIDPIPYAFLVVFMPWITWIWFMGFVSFIQHTHPRLAWYDDPSEWSFYYVQLKSTTHVVFPWPVERLLNNIMDHAAHHLDPAIPLYNLPQSQRILEQSCEEHAAVIHWTPWQYFETCRACKLYDFSRHCWTDFAGNVTSPLGLPRLPFKEMHSSGRGEKVQDAVGV